MNLRDEIMALPPADRLEHALYLLDELMGGAHRYLGGLAREYGLTPAEGRLVCALNAASPGIMTHEALMVAVYGLRFKADMTLLRVYVSRIREKMGPDTIVTHQGLGYAMPVRRALPEGALLVSVAPDKTRWRPDDDAELLRMARNGSSVEAMADELDRTEAAVRHRLRVLRGPKLRVAA